MRSHQFEMHADCFACLVKQVLDTVQYATRDESVQLSVLKELMKVLIATPDRSNGLSIAYDAHVMIRKFSGNDDPFAQVKAESNMAAMTLYPRLKEMVLESRDRLLTACLISATGNVIDYLTGLNFNLEDQIVEATNTGFSVEVIDELRQSLAKSEKVIIVGDNAGEIVCDKILVEEINADTIYVVRGSIFANDATLNDAVTVGMDKIATIMTTHEDHPLLLDNSAPKSILDAFESADTIISKGAINREAFMGGQRGAFCMFKTKCKRTSQEIGAKQGDIVMIKQD